MRYSIGVYRKHFGNYRVTLNEEGDFGQIKKKKREWHAEIRSQDGTLKQYAGIWDTLRDAKEELGSYVEGPRGNPATSKAQFRWAYAAHARGELTDKQLEDFVGNTNYKKLPKRKKSKGKAKMARTTRSRRGRRKSVRRRSNFSMSDLPPAAYTKQWYKVDGRKRKITVVEAAALRRKGHSVTKADPPVRRGPRKKARKKATRRKSTRKGGTRKTARRAYSKSSTSARRWYKVGAAKKYITKTTAERYRKKGYKVRATSAPKSKRSTAKGQKRKTARRAYTKKRTSSKRKSSTRGKRWYKVGRKKMKLTKTEAKKKRERSDKKVRLTKAPVSAKKKTRSSTTRKRRKVRRKSAPRRKKKLTKAERRKISLRNLKKARAALRKKRGGKRGRPRKKLGKRSVVRRAVRKVKKKRPGTRRSKIRRTAMRDYRRKGHKRGRRKVSRLAKDVQFELDFDKAYKRQKLGRSRLRKKVKRMGRHPDHLDKRQTTRKTRKGWKEFAGYPPNLVTKLSKSPVSGQFNGVLVDEIQGKLAHSGTPVTIKPPKNAPLYLIWASGGRTFEVVGSTKAITSLAKGMARGGEPIQIKRINYLAPTYAAPAGTRRTGKEEMFVAYTHKIKHDAFLTWNERSGSKARFPIITKGTRGRSMVNRSGIIL